MTKKELVNHELNLEGKLDMIRKGIRAVTRGFQMSRAIIGPPGLGKSWTVIDEVNNEIEQAAEDGRTLKCQIITGGIKDAMSFYATLCDYNDPNLILILDDINTVITNKDCREILKAASVNEPVRLISYLSSNKVVRGAKGVYFNKIKFKSRIILITNIPKRKIEPAVLSRMSPIEINTTIPQLFEWIGKNLEGITPIDVPLQWKKDVYNFIKNEITIERVKHFDFRAMQDSIMWYSSCVSYSKKLDARGDKIIEVDPIWKKYIATIIC